MIMAENEARSATIVTNISSSILNYYTEQYFDVKDFVDEC